MSRFPPQHVHCEYIKTIDVPIICFPDTLLKIPEHKTFARIYESFC